MSWEITEKEISTTTKLSAEDRYAYFVEKTLEHGKLWSLKNNEGWVLGEATEEIEAIPVWPHPTFARLCATGPWANHEPESISLTVFLERFVPCSVGHAPALVWQFTQSKPKLLRLPRWKL